MKKCENFFQKSTAGNRIFRYHNCKSCFTLFSFNYAIIITGKNFGKIHIIFHTAKYICIFLTFFWLWVTPDRIQGLLLILH